MRAFILRLVALCAALVAGLGGPTAAASPDAAFAYQAAHGGLAEVRLARTALEKSRNPRVDAFARRMIRDHTRNNAELARIMRSEGLAVPTDVGPQNAAVAARLSRLSGRAFDLAYARSQVRGHVQMLQLLQNEVANGRDPRLRAFARRTLPMIRMHLAMARETLNALQGMGGMRMRMHGAGGM